MVTVTTWLLGFSATIIGYIVTHLIRFDPFVLTDVFTQPKKAACLACLGFLVSTMAGYVALLYGGYANRNWAESDKIACRHRWCDLVPHRSKGKQQRLPKFFPTGCRR